MTSADYTLPTTPIGAGEQPVFSQEKTVLKSKLFKAEIEIPVELLEDYIEDDDPLNQCLNVMCARLGLDWDEIDSPEGELITILRRRLAGLGHNLEDFYIEEAPVTWSDDLYDYVIKRMSILSSLDREGP